MPRPGKRISESRKQFYFIFVLFFLSKGLFAGPIEKTFSLDINNHFTPEEYHNFCTSNGFDGYKTVSHETQSHTALCLGDSETLAKHQAQVTLDKNCGTDQKTEGSARLVRTTHDQVQEIDQFLSKGNHSPVILPYEKYKGIDAHQKYKQILQKFIPLMKIATEDSKQDSEAAKKTFREALQIEDPILKDQKLEIVAALARRETGRYPVLEYRGIHFRLYDIPEIPKSNSELRQDAIRSGLPPENAQKVFPDDRPLLDPIDIAGILDRLEVKDGFVYLYKTVLESQLCMIQKFGLNSKYGGIGGASERSILNEKEKDGLKDMDRGRMYMGDFTAAHSYIAWITYNRKTGKRDKVAILRIRLPLDKTTELNLTYRSGYDFFVAGTKIPSEYIQVWNPATLAKYERAESSTLTKSISSSEMNDFAPIASTHCETKE
jgi:hypothetical protein